MDKKLTVTTDKSWRFTWNEYAINFIYSPNLLETGGGADGNVGEFREVCLKSRAISADDRASSKDRDGKPVVSGKLGVLTEVADGGRTEVSSLKHTRGMYCDQAKGTTEKTST